MKVKIGKGVMAKDGKNPFRPGIMHSVEKIEGGFVNSFDNSGCNDWASFARYVVDKNVSAIVVVDRDNVKYTFTK